MLCIPEILLQAKHCLNSELIPVNNTFVEAIFTMKEFFRKLINYNDQCNRELFRLLNTAGEAIPEKGLLLYSHILNAQSIWTSRIAAEPPSVGVWDIHSLQVLQSFNTTNYEKTLLILETYELQEMIHYVNTKGQAYNRRVEDILFHVINHSTYHRAQIAMELKQAGIEPIATDYIFYEPGTDPI